MGSALGRRGRAGGRRGASRALHARTNHAEPGVTAVYDRHGYDAEKRAALEKWARRLQEIVEGKRAEKVVSINGRSGGS
ncbi:MAG: hypothetical protein HY900_38475 [Deltaproteobacteria bacterium]|nr:hypothetical protein [Deltaproteobacteria bacterium]